MRPVFTPGAILAWAHGSDFGLREILQDVADDLSAYIVLPSLALADAKRAEPDLRPEILQLESNPLTIVTWPTAERHLRISVLRNFGLTAGTAHAIMIVQNGGGDVLLTYEPEQARRFLHSKLVNLSMSDGQAGEQQSGWPDDPQ